MGAQCKEFKDTERETSMQKWLSSSISPSGKLQINIWKILQLLLNDEKLSRIFMGLKFEL